MPETAFATWIERAQNLTEKVSLNLPPDWMQGRTGYGGLIAALALKSMRGHVSADRKVRSLQVAFVGPVDDTPFWMHTHGLREGKSVTTIESRVVQKDAVCCVVLASFGGDRTSHVNVAPDDRPEMPGPDESLELPYIDGLTPSFTRHFAYRWALGELPFSGKGEGEIGGWIQFREDTDCLTEEWLVALADAWPTPALSVLAAPAAASTLTWHLGFVHLDRETCSQNEWWAFRCKIDSAERGYVHERSELWDPDGRLVAYGRQTAAVFG